MDFLDRSDPCKYMDLCTTSQKGQDNLRQLQNLVCIVFVFLGPCKGRHHHFGDFGLWILRHRPNERGLSFKKSDNIRGFDWDFRSRRNSHPSLGATMIIHWDAPPAKATSRSTPWKFNIDIAPENRPPEKEIPLGNHHL